MQLAWSLVRRHRAPLAIGALLLVMSRAAALALPAISKLLYDDVIAGGRSELLGTAAALVLAAIAVLAITSLLLTTRVEIVAQQSITELRASLQRHVLALPAAYHDDVRSGTLVARIMNDPAGVANVVGTGLVRMVGGVLTAVIGSAVLLYLNWQLTLAAFALLLLFAAALAFTVARLRPLNRERQTLQADIAGRLSETLAAARLVKVFGAEEHEHAVFRDGVSQLQRLLTRIMSGAALLASFTTLVVGAVTIVIMLVGAGAVLNGTMTPGELLWFATTAGMVAAPLPHVASNAVQLTQALAGLERVAELQAVAAEPWTPASSATDSARARRLRGDVRVENLRFAYANSCVALHGISFVAAAGSTTAIVGPSGAGKSTLLWLLAGIYSPSDGNILVDDRQRGALDARSYRAQLSVVMQDDVLFDGTVRENIAYAQERATEAAIVRAALVAHADGFIRALPNGYDTVIGERGVRLSGGQRQRIAIARALLRDPRILLLDEATSNIDTLNDEAVHAALHAAREGRTTFIIAHRLATIRRADQVLVLDGGRLVQHGTHDTLIAQDGLYRRLHAPELFAAAPPDAVMPPRELRVHARS